ncbi:uncharacterized protein LY89DRAFT_721396 [Mollisia scopiformis]|uniref:Uncharacterized protein n=1 Tax=Mollisia scopiformis TaxID=149040 RepID=A0A194WZJ5_MOLSC|nr:uncharacterized protein LY89DRAFT_721396 [Mollisia scopiformis]KUJ13371.1 hypothetical protein LY89DRAFT_721396 [Mollisia scopiformis]
MLNINSTNPLGQKWEFVDVDKPVKEQDAATRRRVRVGAMRAFRRRQRLQQLDVFQSTRPSDPTRDLESELEQSSSYVSLDQASTTCTDLAQPIEQNDARETLRNLDPAGTKSVGLSQEQHYLLNHFNLLLCHRPFRFPPKTDNRVGALWFHQALEDQLLLEATLHNAAVHLDGLYKRQASTQALRHKANTIRLVNECLKSPDGVSDSIIGAVVLMAWTANYNGNLPEMQLHLDGLARMVRIRGGLKTLGLGGLLHALVTRLDLIAVTLTNSKPRFAALGESGFIDTSASGGVACVLLESMEGVLAPLSVIFKNIRHLLALQDSFASDHGDSDRTILFVEKRSFIFNRLLSTQKSKSPPTEKAHTYLYEPCRIAALIFMEYALARDTPNQNMLRKLCENLQSSFRTTTKTAELQQLWDQDLSSLKVLLWVYYIGGMVATESLDREWFSYRTARCMMSLGFHEWSEVESCLLELLWTDMMHDQACTGLWEQVQQQLRGSLIA